MPGGSSPRRKPSPARRKNRVCFMPRSRHRSTAKAHGPWPAWSASLAPRRQLGGRATPCRCNPWDRPALRTTTAHATSRLFWAVILGGRVGSWSFNCRSRSNRFFPGSAKRGKTSARSSVVGGSTSIIRMAARVFEHGSRSQSRRQRLGRRYSLRSGFRAGDRWDGSTDRSSTS